MTGPLPYLIGIYAPSIAEAVERINELHMGDHVVQFVPDTAVNPRGIWIILRVTGDQSARLRERGAAARPRWTFL